jgi:hypothetical protein
MKFVNELWSVTGFLHVLWIPPPIKQRNWKIVESVKMALSTITLPYPIF